MSILDAAAPPALADTAAPAGGGVRFLGDGRAYWRLLIRGGVLLMFTLGIYRFWLTTDVRRFLWSNTELAGDGFEYTGTARELLIGFLMALAILVPLYTAFFIIALGGGALGEMSGLLSFVLLTLLGHYAVYRARRYRLTRTIFRGVRFDQTGSPWRYAVCALFWWTLIVLTLGLAYPAATSRLERFKMRHTFFGDLPGRFEGSASQLFLRGVVLWVLLMVPLTVGFVATLGSVDWNALETAANAGGEEFWVWLFAHGLGSVAAIGGLTLLWTLLSVVVLYPVFHAILLRWWASGLRFGDLAVTSRLRTGKVLGIYGRFFGYAFLLTLAAIVIGIVGTLVVGALVAGSESIFSEIFAATAAIGLYVATMLGYSTIYQATVKVGLWRCVVESLDISGLAALDRVSAAGEASSPIGEGLADALNVGGI